MNPDKRLCRPSPYHSATEPNIKRRTVWDSNPGQVPFRAALPIELTVRLKHRGKDLNPHLSVLETDVFPLNYPDMVAREGFEPSLTSL